MYRQVAAAAGGLQDHPFEAASFSRPERDFGKDKKDKLPKAARYAMLYVHVETDIKAKTKTQSERMYTTLMVGTPLVVRLDRNKA